MGNRYRLVGIADAELLTGLSGAVRRGNEATADVLAHLVEIEERMLHLDLGFPSLFAYCLRAHGMSEGAAGRRVAASRVCRRFPELFALLAHGSLHLSAVCALAPHLDPANARELFGACAGKSRREVDELLAMRFPKPDMREQIRRLPAASAQSEARTRSDRRARELEPLSIDRYGVRFTADSDLRDLIERARAVASHRLPGGDLVSLFKLALTELVRREEARRFAVGRKPRSNARARRENTTMTPPGGAAPTADERKRVDDTMTTPGEVTQAAAAAAAGARPGGRNRHIAASVRREVYARDGGACSFLGTDGVRCGARAFLEIDHVEPFASGGASTSSNLRLRCRAHNQHHAVRYFGSRYVRAAIDAARRDGAPPKQKPRKVPEAA